MTSLYAQQEEQLGPHNEESRGKSGRTSGVHNESGEKLKARLLEPLQTSRRGLPPAAIKIGSPPWRHESSGVLPAVPGAVACPGPASGASLSTCTPATTLASLFGTGASLSSGAAGSVAAAPADSQRPCTTAACGASHPGTQSTLPVPNSQGGPRSRINSAPVRPRSVLKNHPMPWRTRPMLSRVTRRRLSQASLGHGASVPGSSASSSSAAGEAALDMVDGPFQVDSPLAKNSFLASGHLPPGLQDLASTFREPLTSEKNLPDKLSKEGNPMPEFRREKAREARERERHQAATWREANARSELLCELAWTLKEPEQLAFFQHGGGETLVPTPELQDDQLLFQAARSPTGPPAKPGAAEKRGLEADVKLPWVRRPLQARLRQIRRQARKLWKDIKRQSLVEAAEKAAAARAEQEESESQREQHGGDDDGQGSDVDYKASTADKLDMFANRERSTMYTVFTRRDRDNSELLDVAEVLDFLADIGLHWRTAEERQMIKELIWSSETLELSFERIMGDLLPALSEALRESRRPRVVELFEQLLAFRKGVTVEDTLEALRRLGMHPSNRCCKDALWAAYRQKGISFIPAGFRKATLDTDLFVMFVFELQVRHAREEVSQCFALADKYDIPQDLASTWRHELVSVYKMFHEWDPTAGKFGKPMGALTAPETITVVRESGYMPKTRKQQQALNQLVNEQLREDKTIGFREFFKIMSWLRDIDRERLKRAFDQRVASGLVRDEVKGALSRGDMWLLLEDCGVSPKGQDEKSECTAIIEDVDERGSMLVDRDEFAIACQRMSQRLRVIQREREGQYVVSAGWSEQQLADFRNAFQRFDEDMSEVLEREELTKVMEVLKGQYWQSASSMSNMLLACGIDPAKEVKVNFLTFLRIMKMLDESELRRQQGIAAGFRDRDRTDKLFSCFQSFQSDNSIGDTIRRDDCEKALTVACRSFKGSALSELTMLLHSEPPQLNFPGFLRVLKAAEGVTEHSFDSFVEDMRTWREIVDKEGEEVLSGRSQKKKSPFVGSAPNIPELGLDFAAGFRLG
eukprot:TRINITY_DN91288_c0_g1_i1.p1 TRINITY_DN91288_c0_g1~~TRINITY_DN91288_c0_g1_i1.p1  ORF type:complete len:1039 (+),score=199.63 TRINITY_DN91288_c0_g1_i1:150-3266(+)